MLSRLSKIKVLAGIISIFALLNSATSSWGASDEGRVSVERHMNEEIDMSWTMAAERRASGHSYASTMPQAPTAFTDAEVSLYVQMHEAATGSANRFLLMPWSDLHTIAN